MDNKAKFYTHILVTFLIVFVFVILLSNFIVAHAMENSDPHLTREYVNLLLKAQNEIIFNKIVVSSQVITNSEVETETMTVCVKIKNSFYTS